MFPQIEKGFREIDFRAGINAGVSALVYMLLYQFIPGIDQYLNICVITIAAVFITEMDWKSVWVSGLSRCVIMFIGVLFGFIVVFLDGLVNSDLFVCVLFGIAVICMLVVEKLTGKMYVQCKLGVVALALTVFTFRGAFYAQMGKNCYGYGIMFFLSTVAAVPICAAIMFIWDFIKSKLAKSEKV